MVDWVFNKFCKENPMSIFDFFLKEKAIVQNVLTSLQLWQLLVKISKDELTDLMGEDVTGVNFSENTSVILMSGLQGSSKTTFSGKLANFLKTKNK